MGKVFIHGLIRICNRFCGQYINRTSIHSISFFLVTSKPNSSIANFNKHLIEFFNDSLAFILFSTEEKPFPFKKEDNENTDDIIEADLEDVESTDSSEIPSDDIQENKED